MYKVTPNPPHSSSAAHVDAKLQAAAQRAIHHYLPPSDEDDDATVEYPSTNLFSVSPNIDTETLLANASENLESANQMAATLAFDLDDSQRAIVLGIQQLIDLSALLVDRAQEQVAPAISTTTA
ncbi:DUF6124 family protein [Pseudomonas costantinii]|uniref:DUF3077 domain-containing protein n=1 Tax=Pseudomonas costantinii TaxID=168469 RepID=A0A1S2V4A9_9PSED|nr:DUF6124 family protein [Pseudomonas costantinii]OIN53567.1 hypothetical protein BFL40_08800 [Pseudomonas costantinii]SEE35105.1 hypothetical protein SAMN04515675_5074 [Pseudomonas costantinii]